MVCIGNEDVFECVGERAVTDVMEKNSSESGFFLRVGDVVSSTAEMSDGFLREVHGSERVDETCMCVARIDKIGETQLSDTCESLDIRVL